MTTGKVSRCSRARSPAQSTIGDELKWNVFMRLGSDAVKQFTSTDDSVKAMGALREAKASQTSRLR